MNSALKSRLKPRLTARSQAVAAMGVLSLSAFALVGCSSSGDDSAAAQQPVGTAQAEQTMPRGVSGEIAYVDGDTLQVQGSDSQTAVTFTSDTVITQEVAAALSDVTAGVCITGIGEEGVALTSVAIADAVDGECAFGFGGGAFGFGGGAGFDPENLPEGVEPPSGDGQRPNMPEMPEGGEMPETPDGAPDGAGFGGLASGLVTAVDGSTFTVESTSMGGETSSQEFTVDDATSFTRTQTAGSEALAVGACAVAAGEYVGESYAATSIAVSEAGDAGCDSGFGAGFPSGEGGGRGQRDQSGTGGSASE